MIIGTEYKDNLKIEGNYISWLRIVLINLVLGITVNKLDIQNQFKTIIVKNLILLSLILMIYSTYNYIKKVKQVRKLGSYFNILNYLFLSIITTIIYVLYYLK